jgi:hypothetical protein
MSKLQPIQLEDGTVIYVEATEDLAAPEVEFETGEVGRGGQKGWDSRSAQAQMVKSFDAIESTIKTYTKYTLKAFEDAALANVEKVTIEFGMNISGGAGVPYIAAGTVGCNIKVTVECKFPERQVVANIAQAAQAQRNPPPMPQNPAAPRQ